MPIIKDWTKARSAAAAMSKKTHVLHVAHKAPGGYEVRPVARMTKRRKAIRRKILAASTVKNPSARLKKGTRVGVHVWHSAPGEGLSYPAFYGRMTEDGFSGGWDVWDVQDDNGTVRSVYGFSLYRYKPSGRGPRGNPLTLSEQAGILRGAKAHAKYSRDAARRGQVKETWYERGYADALGAAAATHSAGSGFRSSKIGAKISRLARNPGIKYSPARGALHFQTRAEAIKALREWRRKGFRILRPVYHRGNVWEFEYALKNPDTAGPRAETLPRVLAQYETRKEAIRHARLLLGAYVRKTPTGAYQVLVPLVIYKRLGNPRPIDESDIRSAQRGLGMISLTGAELRDLIKQHEGKEEFASKVISVAARQMLTAKKRVGLINPSKHRNPTQGLIGTSPTVYLDRGSKIHFKGGALRTGVEPRTFDIWMRTGTGYPGWMLGRPVHKIEYHNDAKALKFYKRRGPFRHVFKTCPTVSRIDRVGAGYVVTMSSRKPAWRKA